MLKHAMVLVCLFFILGVPSVRADRCVPGDWNLPIVKTAPRTAEEKRLLCESLGIESSPYCTTSVSTFIDWFPVPGAIRLLVTAEEDEAYEVSHLVVRMCEFAGAFESRFDISPAKLVRAKVNGSVIPAPNDNLSLLFHHFGDAPKSGEYCFQTWFFNDMWRPLYRTPFIQCAIFEPFDFFNDQCEAGDEVVITYKLLSVEDPLPLTYTLWYEDPDDAVEGFIIPGDSPKEGEIKHRVSKTEYGEQFVGDGRDTSIELHFEEDTEIVTKRSFYPFFLSPCN